LVADFFADFAAGGAAFAAFAGFASGFAAALLAGFAAFAAGFAAFAGEVDAAADLLGVWVRADGADAGVAAAAALPRFVEVVAMVDSRWWRQHAPMTERRTFVDAATRRSDENARRESIAIAPVGSGAVPR
jgi:hypothetical protein